MTKLRNIDKSKLFVVTGLFPDNRIKTLYSMEMSYPEIEKLLNSLDVKILYFHKITLRVFLKNSSYFELSGDQDLKKLALNMTLNTIVKGEICFYDIRYHLLGTCVANKWKKEKTETFFKDSHWYENVSLRCNQINRIYGLDEINTELEAYRKI